MIQKMDSFSDDDGEVVPVASQSKSTGRLSRGGYGGGKADRAFIGNCVTQSQIILKNLAQTLKKNKEGLNKNDIAKWQEKIVSISKDAATIRYEDEQRDGVLNEVLQQVAGKRKENEKLDQDEIFNDVDARLKQKMQKFNPANDPAVQNILELTAAAPEEDEDAVLMDTEMTEAHLLCPYTKTRMDEPMKK